MQRVHAERWPARASQDSHALPCSCPPPNPDVSLADIAAAQATTKAAIAAKEGVLASLARNAAVGTARLAQLTGANNAMAARLEAKEVVGVLNGGQGVDREGGHGVAWGGQGLHEHQMPLAPPNPLPTLALSLET